ncbi:hypothetical protein TRIUR3_13747 [Triticum urartu]|uniref:Saposin B-type domain-containing protein n=1 Tax=Triticum urartu TaxID=4572 RepID=M8A157_TRIUA|nr:hypothetical protein TRIUR3_13747 [Triticum urartu]
MYLRSEDDGSIKKSCPRAKQMSSSATTYSTKQQCSYMVYKGTFPQPKDNADQLSDLIWGAQIVESGTLGRQKCGHAHPICGNMASDPEPAGNEKRSSQEENLRETFMATEVGGQVPEIEIIDIAENVCNLKKQEADWMLRIDIVEKGDKLELVDQDEEGHCNSECKTIERACQEVMGYADTDVAEFVYTNKPSVDQLIKFVCKDITKACAADPPPVPKDRVPGEPFAAKPSKDAEMEKIMRSMEGMPGAPNMKMYSRDDLMKNNFGVEGDEDDEDDDEDEDSLPKNLGNILKNKGPQKKDLKQQVVKQIKDTGKKLKGHVSKVSKAVKNWWKGKKKPAKSSKSEL